MRFLILIFGLLWCGLATAAAEEGILPGDQIAVIHENFFKPFLELTIDELKVDAPVLVQKAFNHLKARQAANPSDKIRYILKYFWTYRVQIVPYHTKEGQHFIILSFNNMVEDLDRLDWREHFIINYDGGNDAWRIEYDCQTDTWEGFCTN